MSCPAMFEGFSWNESVDTQYKVIDQKLNFPKICNRLKRRFLIAVKLRSRNHEKG